jgi:hypothetical protein
VSWDRNRHSTYLSLSLIGVPAESDTTSGRRVSWNGSRHSTNLLLSFIAVPVEIDTASGGCRGTEAGTKAFSLSFINVSWNGSIYLREKWNASILQPPSHLHLCILDCTTTRTHSIDVTTHSCHQLTILYRKHYDRLSLCVIFIMVSYFFHWAGKQIFVPFLFLFLLSRVRWLQGKKHHQCPRSLTNEQWWQEKILKEKYLAANLT